MSVLQPPVLVLTMLLLAASVDAASADPLPMRTLAKGAFSGFLEPEHELIKDPAAWDKAWAKHAGGKAAGKMPEVDFSKEMVILVAMGRKNTGGYSLEVAKVEPIGEKLRISVKCTTPPPGAMTIQVLTAPFQMAAVPKSDLAAEFVFTTSPPSKKSASPGSGHP